jgi:3-dehydrosphinganine reductase
MSIVLKTLENRIVLITGGSSGIGLALAHKVADQGAHVWLLARRAELLEQARAELRDYPGRAEFIAADVSDWDQVQAAVRRIEQDNGVPDLVINAAGVTHPGYVNDIPVSIFREMIDINYMGTVHVVKALLPGMLRRHSGWIVNISSAAGFLGVFGYTAYGGSKFAVRGFTETLRAELKPQGIGVSLAIPPDTDTPQLAYENQFKPHETRVLAGNAGMLSAGHVADEILKGIRSGHFIILPGFENKVIYRLAGLLGNAVHPIMDFMIARAQRGR